MQIYEKNGNTVIEGIKCFKISQILDCGQAFRWEQINETTYEGIACGKYLKISQTGETVTFHDTDIETYQNLWKNYFDIERNYEEIVKYSAFNETLKKAAEFGCGIRILRQEPWEALCSFIISQNNNIPRIKGIIGRLCENFGEKTEHGYTFPTAEKISKLTTDDLAVLRSGFRAKYILDAAERVADGRINLEEISNLPIDKARSKLMEIYGVGAKVADCTLLFGMGKIDAFPKDVWIKRAVQVLFDGKFDEKETKYAGVIQQYIFYYARETKLEI
ncbi:MAG: DNA-3-methyladenine glycosylase 2 family protein [Clostridiales bacterium]|nr:DNA-3-methyladenine glycosylase 2 family protein [Candidatus Equinaster intestinalis]